MERREGKAERVREIKKRKAPPVRLPVALLISVATQRDQNAGANSWITLFGLGAVLMIACPCQVAQSTWTRQGSPPFQKGTSGGTPAGSSGPRSDRREPPWTLLDGPSRNSFGRPERKAQGRRVQEIIARPIYSGTRSSPRGTPWHLGIGGWQGVGGAPSQGKGLR